MCDTMSFLQHKTEKLGVNVWYL